MPATDTPEPRIGVLVVAYNAASTLASVLDRIPTDFRRRIAKVLVFDDHSQDSTYLVGPRLPAAVRPTCRSRSSATPRTSATAATRRPATGWAIEHDLDIVVLLHGDGQYAPEMLPEMVAPLAAGEARRRLRLPHDADEVRPATVACRSTSTSATGS